MAGNTVVLMIVVGYLFFLIGIGIYSSKKLATQKTFWLLGEGLGPF
ncbi:hypothetical protein PTW35_11505 [Photobacterium sp. DA100]|nr:hypothetical protein [Photobacterium sp. DA100]WEM41258.1 hypothetical protein PTW35_11505 [Photobacterium sp. DA100]